MMANVKKQIAKESRSILTNGSNLRHAGVLVSRSKGYRYPFLSRDDLRELQDIEAVAERTVTKQQAPRISVRYVPR